MLAAAGSVLKTDADFQAAIALTFRIALMNVFFAGDIYAHTGVVTDPRHPPKVGDSLEQITKTLRDKPFRSISRACSRRTTWRGGPGRRRSRCWRTSSLNIIADNLRDNPDYYAQTNERRLDTR